MYFCLKAAFAEDKKIMFYTIYQRWKVCVLKRPGTI
jgi:hypothetical protein